MSSGPAVKPSENALFQYPTTVSQTLSATRNILAISSIILLDMLAIGSSIVIAYVARIYALPIMFQGSIKPHLLADTMENLWWFPLIIFACMAYEDLYQKRLPYWKEVEKTLKASTLAITFTISLLYLSKLSAEISRSLVLISWFTTIICLPLFRYLGKTILVKLDIWTRPVLIVGAGETGKLILKALTREQTMGYQVIGFLDDNKAITHLANPITKQDLQVLGTFRDAGDVIERFKIREVIVAAPGLAPKDLVDLTNRLQPLVNNVMVVPDLFGLSMNGIEVEYFFDEQTLLLNIKNQLRSALNRGVKRLFDLVTGLIISIICMPIILIIAVIIRLDSKGPAFFKQERVGQNGSTFTCYKFRTMYLEGDKILKDFLEKNPMAHKEWQTFNKLKEKDPRVTRVGFLLRKYSLDELPQLINVIVGDMSLVGPRPYMVSEKRQMSYWAHDILVTKPGITGLWQVSGRNEIEFVGRLKLDTWYVRNWSLWLDMILLIKTFKVVLKSEGAY